MTAIDIRLYTGLGLAVLQSVVLVVIACALVSIAKCLKNKKEEV